VNEHEKMRNRLAVILVLTSSIAVAGTAKISGTVVDEHGVPVKHMTVEAWPLDMGHSGGTDQALTDENGHFVLTVIFGRLPDGRAYGMRWAVYPRQEKGDYYADLSSRFYKTAAGQAQQIEFFLDAPEANVELRPGPKAGALKGKVTDRATGVPVKPEFEFAWISDPENKMVESTSNDYRILLPSNTDIKLTVLSRGYKPWSYQGAINVGPGQDMTLDIRMEQLPSANK
jgi:hypothetical protein